MAEEEKIYITTTELIKQLGNIDKVDETTKILPMMPLGKRDMIKVIGQDKYDEYLDLAEDDFDYQILARAEAYFDLCYIARALNKVSTGSGYTRSTGFQDSRQENMGESELESMIESYRAEANNLLTDYKIVNDTDEDGNDDSARAGNITMISI